MGILLDIRGDMVSFDCWGLYLDVSNEIRSRANALSI
jgi:hypothetical protein